MADRATLRAYLQDLIGLGTNAAGLDRANTTIDERITSMDDLAELNEDDFARMGVKKVKDQKKILKGVQECIQKNETVKDKEESCKAINNRAETENNMTASEGREKVVEEGNEFNNK